jgi:predicted aspartyl protease
MHNKFVFYTLVLALVSAGVWGVMQINFLSQKSSEAKRITSIDETGLDTINAADFETSQTNSAGKRPSNSEIEVSFSAIQRLIRLGHSQLAANKINQHYSYLSSVQLELLKDDFLIASARANGDTRKSILLDANSVFDQLDIWKALASASARSADWQLAFDAQLRASELENDSVELEALLTSMVKSSGHLRAGYEKNGDQLSVIVMYQRLVALYPHFSLFQLELAHAHTKLDNHTAAEDIYASLRYHPELGEIAQYALARIRNSETERPSVASAQGSAEKLLMKDVVVPLIAAGNSFLIDASIERQGSRLLLDTGASITALSSELIQRLNLVPTGQSIRLSTANGLKLARLYQVKNLSLGRLTLQNMIVAEIDLDRRGGFNGLLGTDALNKLESKYSYVIDNQKNALIFRAR